ncbi:HU family DNA-binding protein [Spiroplasma endosymbiont of Cantharis lateralis]|uniref:HU family DNA-binding protein n=1 Tax=Spiroplasma endosymbiont of Cantharis lateralis TaxID=3066277 RepID=UPI00313B5C77
MIKQTQKVTKKEICKNISINTGISQTKVSYIYDEIFKEIKKQLKEEKSLSITNFGRLKIFNYLNLDNKKCYLLKIKKSKKGWKNEK